MIDHIGLRTARFESSKTFFIAALAPLGITPGVEYPGGVGFAREGAPAFWLAESTLAPSSMHLARQATSRPAVDAFYAAALAAGAIDNGGPGVRVDYHPPLLRRVCHRSGWEHHRSGLSAGLTI